MRGANDFRQYSSQRLRLPNERPPLGPRLRRLLGVLLTLALLGGIGVGVYFGVTLLLEEDDSTATEVAPPADTEADPAQTQAEAATAETDAASQPETEAAAAEVQSAPESGEGEDAATDDAPVQQSAGAEGQQQSVEARAAPVAVSAIEPSVAEEPVTPAQIDGAEIVAERVTAEPIPAGIPRSLADGASYDPTEPATVFTSRWPVGTTLRLVRLPGATLLTDEQQAEVVGTEALVVVRGTESSNTDLQLSPAAFDRIAVYGTERIIAVRVEVTAAPP